jgi:thiamine biosynthesis lipoprotein
VTSRFPSISFEALGTTAVVVSGDPRVDLPAAARAVRSELEYVDRTCSRFRSDSDLMRVNASLGSWVEVDPLLVEAVNVALRAARLTGGLVDLTVGGVMLRIGYDRDFAEVAANGVAPASAPLEIAAPGWWLVETSENPAAVKVAPGVHIDLGSTAKALAADRSAARAAAEIGGGVLVGLGGDIAVGGPAPEGGWPVGIAEDHAAVPEPGETISIASGGVATSSTTVRRWSRGARSMHHIVDPRSGRPAVGPWRTVSVCAATCVDANIASTASIVAGDEASAWLERQGLPARLVGNDGTVHRLNGWPARGSS